MADNTVTLVLDGEVPLTEFAHAIANFNDLIGALSEDVSGGKIDWVIDDLQYSSGMVTAAGRGDQQAVEKAVLAYGQLGIAMQDSAPLPFSPRTTSYAMRLVTVADMRLSSIRMETAQVEAVIPTRPAGELVTMPVRNLRAAFGGVYGRIQTLSSRGKLRFTLFDLIHDKAVSCYFEEGKQDLVLDMWGRLAVVEGLVSRDATSGRPLAIRGVSGITPAHEAENRYSYQQARGAAPSLTGLSAEEAIRRIRDAE